MKTRIILLIIILQTTFVYGQTLKGKIVNKEGEAVENAAVYIRETLQGIAADDRGEFQTKLKSGNYTVETSSLGYEKKTVPVTITGNKNETITIQLETKVYSLKGVVVTNKEDPAYPVMRKAIAKAPYHLNQVKTYEAESYIKGSVKIGKIPKLLGNMQIQETGKKIKDYSDKLYLIEKHVEIKFSKPNNYEIKTLAYSSAAPKEIFGGGDNISSYVPNIYSPKMDIWISPLAPDAFTYYKFKYEGITQEGTQWVNKIKVIPRKKNEKLLSGWIYIAENTWNVMLTDLTGTETGVTQRFKINYNEVKPTVFLPTANEMKVDVDLMGIKATVNYYSSFKYKNVEQNEQISAVENVITPQLKENLTNRTAAKVAKEIKKTIEPEDTTRNKSSLEIKPIPTNNVKTTLDSLYKQRDSLYWASVRDLPLHEEEIQSYRREESAQSKTDTQEGNQRQITVSADNNAYTGTLFGVGFNIGKKIRISNSGLLGAVPEYNFVDGFWLGQRINLRYRPATNRQFTFSPEAYYVTARRTVNWKLSSSYQYAPLRNGELNLAAGNTTSDFNRETGNSRLINSIASLIAAKNYINFYKKQFAEANNRIDIANGLILKTGLTYEKRSYLDNHTSFNFFSNKPFSNLPHPMFWTENPAHTATIATVQLDYTPRHYYRIQNGRKRYVESAFPTFSLNYQKAIPLEGENAASFDRLEATIRQDIKLNLFNSINYTVNAGTFLNSEKLYFPDYKHFPTSQLPITNQPLNYGFSLLSDYTNSTSKAWLQAHATYTSSYLLLKNIPFMQTYMFDESLHLRTLLTDRRRYVEAGYTVGISDLGRAGVFIGTNDAKYLAVGFVISLPFLNL